MNLFLSLTISTLCSGRNLPCLELKTWADSWLVSHSQIINSSGYKKNLNYKKDSQFRNQNVQLMEQSELWSWWCTIYTLSQYGFTSGYKPAFGVGYSPSTQILFLLLLGIKQSRRSKGRCFHQFLSFSGHPVVYFQLLPAEAGLPFRQPYWMGHKMIFFSSLPCMAFLWPLFC